MGDLIHMPTALQVPTVSPYLLRPLRTREEAAAEIAARRTAYRRSVGSLRLVSSTQPAEERQRNRVAAA